jgi:hypothetical protein
MAFVARPNERNDGKTKKRVQGTSTPRRKSKRHPCLAPMEVRRSSSAGNRVGALVLPRLKKDCMTPGFRAAARALRLAEAPRPREPRLHLLTRNGLFEDRWLYLNPSGNYNAATLM